MKSKVLFALNFVILLAATVTARKSPRQFSLEDDNRFQRQSDFDFPGPRSQNPASFQSDSGRHRTRTHDPPVFVDFGADVPLQSDDGSVNDGGSSNDPNNFQDEVRPSPPARSFRPRHQQQQSLSDDIGISGGEVGGKLGQQQELIEEEQKPEPDRLELLLKDSKFACSSKKPGYYADDGLSCEVFHYCNDGVRHSWMCPAGTVFHQIHLICMQEGGDNICKQSSKYYVVNDYLYKPLVDSTKESNGTIRYADRYFPVDGEDVLDSGRQRGQGQSFRGQDIDQNDNDFRGGPAEPQSQFFELPSPPPSRHSSGGSGSSLSSGGGSRFRPSSLDEESNSNFAGVNDDLGSSFVPEEDTRVHLLPPQNRFRSGGGGRTSSSRGLQFPLYDRDV